MSADRYEIDMHDDGTFIITNLNGHRFIVDANCVDIRSRAIRQQARDLAERDARIVQLVTAIDAFNGEPCEAIRHAEQVYDLTMRAEQAEARLAAIEAAPTVAVIVRIGQMKGSLLIARHKAVPAVDTELIARPAKD